MRMRIILSASGQPPAIWSKGWDRQTLATWKLGSEIHCSKLCGYGCDWSHWSNCFLGIRIVLPASLKLSIPGSDHQHFWIYFLLIHPAFILPIFGCGTFFIWRFLNCIPAYWDLTCLWSLTMVSHQQKTVKTITTTLSLYNRRTSPLYKTFTKK